jgi:hypothetical protein
VSIQSRFGLEYNITYQEVQERGDDADAGEHSSGDATYENACADTSGTLGCTNTRRRGSRTPRVMGTLGDCMGLVADTRAICNGLHDR